MRSWASWSRRWTSGRAGASCLLSVLCFPWALSLIWGLPPDGAVPLCVCSQGWRVLSVYLPGLGSLEHVPFQDWGIRVCTFPGLGNSRSHPVPCPKTALLRPRCTAVQARAIGRLGRGLGPNTGGDVLFHAGLGALEAGRPARGLPVRSTPPGRARRRSHGRGRRAAGAQSQAPRRRAGSAPGSLGSSGGSGGGRLWALQNPGAIVALPRADRRREAPPLLRSDRASGPEPSTVPAETAAFPFRLHPGPCHAMLAFTFQTNTCHAFRSRHRATLAVLAIQKKPGECTGLPSAPSRRIHSKLLLQAFFPCIERHQAGGLGPGVGRGMEPDSRRGAACPVPDARGSHHAVLAGSLAGAERGSAGNSM